MFLTRDRSFLYMIKDVIIDNRRQDVGFALAHKCLCS